MDGHSVIANYQVERKGTHTDIPRPDWSPFTRMLWWRETRRIRKNVSRCVPSFLLLVSIFSSSFIVLEHKAESTYRYPSSTLGLAKMVLKARRSDWCRLNGDTGVVTLLRAAECASKYDALGNILGTLRYFQEWTRADFIESSLLMP